MDLIDMRSMPDGEYKWILHTKDHFTKFSWAYPLKTKEAESVAEKLLQQFYLFGASRILQSDNGKEFVAKIIKVLTPSCYLHRTVLYPLLRSIGLKKHVD